MKAMIFAAGFGKRLRPLTDHKPKPLIEVREKPILDWILQQLALYGITDIIINTHYLAEEIEKHIEKRKILVTKSYEQEILGTGGGLYKTIDFWDENDFYLCNSDILCTANLHDFFLRQKQQNALATLAVNDRQSNSMLLIDEEGFVVGLQRNSVETILRPVKGQVRPVGFCGMHVINPRIFEWIESPIEFSIIDEYLKIIKKGGKIHAWDIGNAYWEDIGTKQALENANKHFPGFNY